MVANKNEEIQPKGAGQLHDGPENEVTTKHAWYTILRMEGIPSPTLALFHSK